MEATHTHTHRKVRKNLDTRFTFLPPVKPELRNVEIKITLYYQVMYTWMLTMLRIPVMIRGRWRLGTRDFNPLAVSVT
jgi:hypothetical protein